MVKRGRRSKLTPAAERKICKFIRKGTFEWVAAEASGISHRTFYNWITAGEAAETKEGEGGALADQEQATLHFLREVRQARADVRAEVEIRVMQDDPLVWLKNGPGKTRGGREGWTDPTKRIEHTGEDGGPILLAAAMAELEEEEQAAKFTVHEEAAALPVPANGRAKRNGKVKRNGRAKKKAKKPARKRRPGGKDGADE